MPEIIQIEGDLVKVLQTELIREAKLADLLPHIENRPPITIGPLPKSAIYVHWDESDPKNKRVQFICEQTPGVKNARYNQRRYAISIPWTYWVIDFSTAGNPTDSKVPWTLQNSRIYWAREQVKDLDSMVGTALVPNCDTRGGICYGSTGVPANLPLGVRVDRLIAEFWQTTFTHDSGTGSPWQSETGSTSWARWDRESKADPNAWMKFPEWDDKKAQEGRGRIVQKSLRSLLGSIHDRTRPIEVEGMIPDMVMPFTFGRAEEYARTWTPVDRHRMFVALQNLQADDPAAVEAPAAPAGPIIDDDLGGEVIPDGQ